MKEEILKIITDYYLKSGDFNGFPLYNFDKNYNDLICKLIDEDKVEVLSSAFVINPHIKALRLNIDKEDQKKEVINKGDSVVLYPTEKYLKSLSIGSEKPFTKMLLDGQEQLKILFFDIEILEPYFQDPRYKIFWYEYGGSIEISEEFYYENLENEYINDFGLGYHKEKPYEERVVGVFLGDLACLSLKAQLKWKLTYIECQHDYIINEGFYRNQILGEWIDEVSIYDAILDEMIVINKMCENMGIPCFFNKLYKPHTFEKPEDYRIIFLPTLKNYYSFILTLEKMIVDNINYKTFITATEHIRPVERKDEEGNIRKPLQMMPEWFNQNSKSIENVDELIITPLKSIRQIRQVPAHKIYSNHYDKSLFKKQNDIILKTYKAIRNIRLFFTNYPENQDIKIPEYLITGEKIRIY
ncbi:AAA family ATPase containing protein [Tepidanaerobacter acetatoxydans Re1]|uniref:AAA family ATPase containing protein n=1 Tax=Tepidanaerobacter acetatoxydans (strain DSM 21804 / JCM 16047 / Re1) TaxID=1209989 RepID=F4LSQ3_TEPAE|nr:hypothetical protein [Tepidanaerobacter acetatoxydans]AEE92443.1 AAA family ATPase containing protein [Tepidanaerobacter acetatoxydans Re1]CCP27360.1 AAA family ATPase containing protein [Tepidanaerobacter acetatoxydans Re1]